MRKFRWLATVTAVAVYLQVVLGSVVRITGSGMGCKDWPFCYQHESGRFAYRTLLEVAHRLFGTVGGLLVLATAVAALVLYRKGPTDGGLRFPRGLLYTTWAALGLYAFQGVLGGVTVRTGNQPYTVALHLGNAELVFGVLLVVALWAAWTPTRQVSPVRRLRLMLAGVAGAYLVLVTGAVVVGTGASAACVSWPLCGAAGRLADTHMLHRLVVLLSSVAILGAVHSAARAWRGSSLALLAYMTALLLVAEAAVGAAQVLLGLPPALRSIHVALASGVWAATVLMAAGAWLARAGADIAPGRGARARFHPAEAAS